MSAREPQVEAIRKWMEAPRFSRTVRLYTATDVAGQRGTIETDYPVARCAADEFHARLRELFDAGQSITTFGPYSPGQAVTMKRMGLEGIYLGGWATSAKGSPREDPGPDLASYPLGQVPDEAAVLVRALLTADRNQHFERMRMSADQRKAGAVVDYRPFIIADADTGHGGEAHVRNLIRRFVEAGVPGYHIEDQKPGLKKCGHQGGKVLVAADEQIKRLSAARLQLDIMGVAGIIVARTDAESATFLDNCSDERDQPFILGATNRDLPSFKAATFAVLRQLHELGVEQVRGHLLSGISDREHRAALEWLEGVGLSSAIAETAERLIAGDMSLDAALDPLSGRLLDIWRDEAGLKTYADAVAERLAFRAADGEPADIDIDDWLAFAQRASWHDAREKANAIGLDVTWDPELPKTPDGFYQIQGGIDFAIARSLAVAPFADVLWMETKTASLADAKRFAEAVHERAPDQMLAYNLSPSFNWDTTGMSEEEMRRFPADLGALGFVFNFITYGGHQIDGLAAEDFARALKEDGMLALARLQRKFRLVESPYKTPQTLVGGPRLDGALMASSGRTAATKAMGKGSTQHQHLVQTEVPPRLLEEWLQIWRAANDFHPPLHVELRPHTAGSELLALRILDADGGERASVAFANFHDRRGRSILSVRDSATDPSLRKRRLMTLAQLFLIHRYKAVSAHYVTPTEDNQHQTHKMKRLGIFADVKVDVGRIIVADVNRARVAELVRADREALGKLIRKEVPQTA